MQNEVIEHKYKIFTLWESQSHLEQSELLFFFLLHEMLEIRMEI